MNKSDPISDKLERISKAIDEMKIGEIVSPTDLFRKRAKGINPTTGNGWFEISDSLREMPIKRLETNGKTSGYIKLAEEDTDFMGLIIKKLNEIKKKLDEK